MRNSKQRKPQHPVTKPEHRKPLVQTKSKRIEKNGKFEWVIGLFPLAQIWIESGRDVKEVSEKYIENLNKYKFA